jgi:hypothetical protein
MRYRNGRVDAKSSCRTNPSPSRHNVLQSPESVASSTNTSSSVALYKNACALTGGRLQAPSATQLMAASSQCAHLHEGVVVTERPSLGSSHAHINIAQNTNAPSGKSGSVGSAASGAIPIG